MTRNWLVLFAFLSTWCVSSNMPFSLLGTSPKSAAAAVVSVALYDEPDISSPSSQHEFHGEELSIDYEYCNFYRVVVSNSFGQPNHKFLYKNDLQISELGLSFRQLPEFQQKNCDPVVNSKPRSGVHDIFDTGVPIEGLQYINPNNPPPAVRRQMEQQRFRQWNEALKRYNNN